MLKQLLLVGAGQAHLYVLKQLQKKRLTDVEITLLTPSQYQYYSGMFSGYAEGLYTEDDIRVDVEKLAGQSGVDWQKGAAMSVDPERKVILTEEGKLIDFDIVSFDIGSLTAGTDITGVLEHANVIKPNYRVPEVMGEACAAQRLVVAGGGATGVEMAQALHARRMKEDESFSTVLISSGKLLEKKGQKAAQLTEALLKKKGIDVYKNDPVKKVMKDKLVTESDRIIPFDMLLWLTGPKSQKLFANGGLPVDDDGYLLVEETLQVKRYPFIFAAGGCAALSPYPEMEKSGDVAVKQAAVLWENINGFLGNGTGTIYSPPHSKLSILSTGNKKGLLLYKGKAMYGKWPWKLKDLIDRHFIKKYQ